MKSIHRYIEGNHIITTYVLEIGGVKVAVDPGPPNALTPTDADYVICTHIHNDHCGASGQMGKPVYVHERYVRHLLDPTKLWQSTREVLGPIADLFGQPVGAKDVRPLRDGDRLFDAIDVYFTPGHAPHHVMFYYRDEGVLFVGDGAGVYVPELKAIFPTTPPPFKYDEYIQSLRRVSALGARQICFPHFACTEEVELLKAHAEQIKAWREAARSVKERGGGVEDLLVELQRVDENAAKIAGRRGLLHDFFLMQTLIGLLQSA
ncbi:MAG: MBL fold metallo-hydrolase [Thermoproteus sp.]